MRNGSSWRRWLRLRRDAAEEFDDELRFHFEQRVRDYVSRGMDEDAARAAARERLGDLERVRDECTGLLAAERRRDDRRMRLNVSWLDVKLGARMVAKYPWLSTVSVLGMAVAIAIGAGYFAAFGAFLNTGLPFDEGDLVVSLRNVDATRSGGDQAASAYDFVQWRSTLTAVRELGAYRDDSRNLITRDGRTELADVAAMTASGFRLARVTPLLGRALLEEDARTGAPPVLVVGYEAWQRRFNGDPSIIGKQVRLGETVHTIVGVMPEGFAFPVKHRYWVPLRIDEFSGQPGAGPPIRVFGRLPRSVSLAQARTELAEVGRRVADASPATHANLRPQLVPYTRVVLAPDDPVGATLAVRAIQVLVGLLLVIAAVNVAILVYARTVTRTGEIAVRSALGASRRRIVAQLFVEALVLSMAAAAIGLTLTGIALEKIEAALQAREGQFPFWLDFGLSPGTILYGALLTVVAGAIIGVVPALKATGTRLQGALQQAGMRGASLQLGRVWTALIIVQVAVAVAALPAALSYAEQSFTLGTRAPAPAADRLLRARLVMTRDAASPVVDSAADARAFGARFADRLSELMRRLDAEPALSGVTVASRFPGTESGAPIEIDDVAPASAQPSSPALPSSARVWAQTSRIAPDLFDVFGVPVLAGRGLTTADAGDPSTAVVVSESFARRIAGGANVVGRRVRYAARGEEDAAGPWLEIVGVVPDFADEFTVPSSFDPVQARMYHALTARNADPVVLVVRVADGATGSFAARFREIAASVDPTLVLERVEVVADAWDSAQLAFWSLAVGIGAVMLSVLLLSAAGIHAMMSFTVARRRREIGIRAALGADPRRVLAGIFARAAAQLGAGVLAGLLLAGAFEWIGDGTMQGHPAILLPAVAALMLTVGLLAALGPARRTLAIQPTEALRAE